MDLAEICAQHGVRHVLISPGSRNAPLALSFSRHPEITTKMVSDERSAGYIGLGMAQGLKEPIVLLCTSGTAALNYGPAIAEAFYQKVPLLIFTADRPPEWIDQNDGQSIRQRNLFQNHVKHSYGLPVSLQHPDEVWQLHRTINQAINTCISDQAGPVHINAPFREPFYPRSGQPWEYRKDVSLVNIQHSKSELETSDWGKLVKQWSEATNILVVGGQYPKSEALISALEALQQHCKVPILGDITSNLHRGKGVIKHVELILGQDDAFLDSLKPDLLLTFGGAHISKNLKRFLRRHSPDQHWHVQESGYPPDTFKSLSAVIPMDPAEFIQQLTARTSPSDDEKWSQTWKDQEASVTSWIDEFLRKQDFNELAAVQQVLDICPEAHLHLSNSSPVRWSDLIGGKSQITEISSNRGTSGIDGCTSSALGHALVNQRLNLLITGDMAFFYDRNAFWHQLSVPNLKIVLLNNHGGGIFRLIDGPKDQPELERLFVTQQSLSAKNTCKDFNIKYLYCNHRNELKTRLTELFEPNDHISLLEIEFSNNMSEIYQELKTSLKQNHV